VTTEEIRSATKAFMARFFQNDGLRDDDDIFEMGFVNSLFAIQLVMFVEREFQLSITNEDLHLDNFRTLNALAGLVKRKSS
jgi:methoxymalonate biosynthesis acyl carrier protein